MQSVLVKSGRQNQNQDPKQWHVLDFAVLVARHHPVLVMGPLHRPHRRVVCLQDRLEIEETVDKNRRARKKRTQKHKVSDTACVREERSTMIAAGSYNVGMCSIHDSFVNVPVTKENSDWRRDGRNPRGRGRGGELERKT
jgi:hypothetical protein